MRKGLAVIPSLLFNIRERAAGRLHIPMDNVCSTCLPPSRLDHNQIEYHLVPVAVKNGLLS